MASHFYAFGMKNQKYLQFSTKHFSNYYIVEGIEENIPNPPTGDNILNYVVLLLVSSGAILAIKKYKKLER